MLNFVTTELLSYCCAAHKVLLIVQSSVIFMKEKQCFSKSSQFYRMYTSKSPNLLLNPKR